MIVRQIVASILFIAITIVLSVLSVPVAFIDRSGKLYCALARFWSRIFCVLYGVKVRVTGSEYLAKGSNYVFIANHSSYTDIPVLLLSIPRDIRLILRHTLTRIPIWGWALLAGPFIIINRSNPSKAKKTLTAAIKRIQEGESVLLFPEGTRTRDGKLQQFKRGAFHMAFASTATIVPVKIQGTFELLPRTERLPKTNQVITVTIGKPIAPPKKESKERNDREQEITLMEEAHEAIEAL